jgi:hypothetical protein
MFPPLSTPNPLVPFPLTLKPNSADRDSMRFYLSCSVLLQTTKKDIKKGHHLLIACLFCWQIHDQIHFKFIPYFCCFFMTKLFRSFHGDTVTKDTWTGKKYIYLLKYTVYKKKNKNIFPTSPCKNIADVFRKLCAVFSGQNLLKNLYIFTIPPSRVDIFRSQHAVFVKKAFCTCSLGAFIHEQNYLFSLDISFTIHPHLSSVSCRCKTVISRKRRVVEV